MLNVYYTYDIVAAILTAVLLIIYMIQKGFSTRTGKIYLGIMHMNLFLALLDLASYYVIYYRTDTSVVLKYLINIPCMLMYVGINVLFYFYVLNVTKGDIISKFERWLGYLVFGVLAALILTTPFTHRLVDVSAPGKYIRGEWYPLMYLFGGVLVVYEICMLFKYRRFLRILQISAIFGGIVFMTMIAVIQMLFPGHLVIAVCASVVLVLIYAALEDPSEYMFSDSICYNDKAFYTLIARSQAEKSINTIAVFRIEGYEYISHMLDDKFVRQFRDEIIDFFHRIYGKKNVFCFANDIYGVIVEGERRELAEQAIAEFPGVFRIDEVEFAVSLRATELKPGNFKSTSDVRHVIEAVITQHREGTAGQRIEELTGEALDKRDREIKILQCVRNALKNEGFEIYYQPILEEETGHYASAEALLRMRDTVSGSGEFISPAVFIPLAEQNGLIIPIGEYVFEHVCRFYTDYHLEEMGVRYIEVNLSPIQCMQQDLTLRLQAIMRKYGISPDHINLEITETANSSDRYVMQRNIKSLLNRGMSFSLDDFGTGFSNIDHLARLPVTLIKFDKSLIDDAMADENSKIILSSLMQMLKGLRYRCVCEGIETEEMYRMVRDMGCDYYQGFLFSKPIPEGDYIEFLKKN